jgi:hypothetical protein
MVHEMGDQQNLKVHAIHREKRCPNRLVKFAHDAEVGLPRQELRDANQSYDGVRVCQVRKGIRRVIVGANCKTVLTSAKSRPDIRLYTSLCYLRRKVAPNNKRVLPTLFSFE